MTVLVLSEGVREALVAVVEGWLRARGESHLAPGGSTADPNVQPSEGRT